MSKKSRMQVFFKIKNTVFYYKKNHGNQNTAKQCKKRKSKSSTTALGATHYLEMKEREE